jgi:predicted dehydrogenase
MALNRRTFLQSTAAAMPAMVTASSLASAKRVSPSDRLNVAMIGCGKMANSYHIPQLLKQADVQLVAVCEVDTTRREWAAERVNQRYSDGKKDFKGCSSYVDFREIIARDDIDAVCIATPDHWHTIPLIEACKAGKDVYCEKPLTLTIAESKACIDATRKYKRIVQTGSQQRSGVFGPFREAIELIHSGRLGKIHRVTVGVGDPSVDCDLPEETMEPGLDWDMWQGCAPARAYNSILSPRGVHKHFPAWRSYREYSGGGHTDMGAHHYDIAQWALKMDQSGPVEIIPPKDPQAKRGVRFLFENGVEMVHGGPSGCVFHGENGTLHIDRGENDVHLPKSPGHHRNWLDCIKSREMPIAEVEKGARTAAIIHLGNLAYQHHKTLKWNPETWQFGDPANRPLLDRERRDPWQLPTI